MNLNDFAATLGASVLRLTGTLYGSAVSLNSNLVMLAKRPSSPPVKTLQGGIGGSLGLSVESASLIPTRPSVETPVLRQVLKAEHVTREELSELGRSGWMIDYDIRNNQYILERPYGHTEQTPTTGVLAQRTSLSEASNG